MKKRLVAIFLLFTFIVNTSYAEKIIFDAYGRPMKTMSSSNSKLDIPKIEIDNVPSTSKLQQNSQKTNTENTVEIKYEVDTVNKPEIITDKKLNNKAETNIQKDNKISQENSVMYQNYPKMTKNMSTRQKKAFIRKYMENLKYADYAIDDIIENIPWSEVTDDFAPSFYIALDKGYFIKDYGDRQIYKRNLRRFCNCATNESIMSKINNLIERMLNIGYSKRVITDTLYNIYWSEITDGFAPSFYTALDKKYIYNYIPSGYLDYCANETVMAKMNNIIERMLDKGYSEKTIQYTVRWTGDFPPSFYTALDKGYLNEYAIYHMGEYYRNETAMANMNNIIERMLDKGYSEKTIQDVFNSIRWLKMTDDFAPSFYTALDKKYIDNYIPLLYLDYCANETVMANMNNIIERMLDKGFSKETIKDTLNRADWSKVTDDFAPSFYTALDKGYINKYIDPYSSYYSNHPEKYYANETVMARMNNFIEYMLDKRYSVYTIKDTLVSISWLDMTDDFAPSFYTALDKGYIKYIKPYKKYYTNETFMARMNNFIEYMLKKGYSQEDIQTRIRYAQTSIKDSNISDAQLLKSVNKKIPLAEKNKVLASIQHWHNTNIYHTGDPDFGSEAVALCAYSCYGGPTFFIVTPLVITGFVVTELLYLPIGLIIGY